MRLDRNLFHLIVGSNAGAVAAAMTANVHN
jgi:hypothetical protein